MRVRVQPDALAARNISLDELTNALRAANANTPVGTLEGAAQTLTLQANRQLRNAAEFAELIVSNRDGNPVRLRDVATVEDSFETVKTARTFNGETRSRWRCCASPTPTRSRWSTRCAPQLPASSRSCRSRLRMTPVNDRSVSIRAALHDVTLTLLGTIVLVVLVIFLFLRRFVATVIPTLSLPVSLVGAVSLLWAFGYTLDNISLLGLTLAVGLVVDDAIVMLENIMRHVEKGEPPFQAALRGSREVGFTIISISSSLVAVFIPIFFMPGVIGLLFHEFAVVVALAIVVSAFVSLTLVPMLASRFLTDEAHKKPPGAIVRSFERGFDALARWLHALARRRAAPSRHRAAWSRCDLRRHGWLFVDDPEGLLPGRGHRPDQDHDRGRRGHLVPGDGAAAGARVAAIFRADPNVDDVNSFNGGSGAQNTGRLFINLKPRGERPPMKQVVESLRRKLREVPGITVYMRPIQNLQLGGRQSKAQYQYILQSVQADELNDWADKLQEPMRADPMFRDVTSDSQLRGLQASLKIDRDRANTLGVSIDAIRTALYSAFGERQVSTIYTAGRQLPGDHGSRARREAGRERVQQHLRALSSGALVPLSSFATVERTVGPTSINHVGQLQAVTVSFNLAPGARSATPPRRSSRYREQIRMPASIITSYGGDAAVFKSSQGSQAILIVAALLVIYVLLGVLYESYIHPLTILAGLPSAAVGALLTLRLFGQDLTLIATIGILLLIGIVKKNAIMMIDFALDAQRDAGHGAGGGDPRGVHAALPADHDDDAGRADGRAADRARPRRRRRAAPAARPRRRRRARLLAGDHALHHAGDLPRARPLQRQGAGDDARGLGGCEDRVRICC